MTLPPVAATADRELIAWLRERAESNRQIRKKFDGWLERQDQDERADEKLDQAANRLSALLDEVERLKGLLRDAVDICGGCGGTGKDTTYDHEGTHVEDCADCAAARAALSSDADAQERRE